ncbi:hypothetical protein Pelo_11460 [Pelomyxa schiedti]|nr:hypothetical protein Pelo_11460 [Pelomyxa schiedti]
MCEKSLWNIEQVYFVNLLHFISFRWLSSCASKAEDTPPKKSFPCFHEFMCTICTSSWDVLALSIHLASRESETASLWH